MNQSTILWHAKSMMRSWRLIFMRKKTTKIHSHAWHGSWSRPMSIDEGGLHPFTIARMTDHNVSGVDDGQARQRKTVAAESNTTKGKKRRTAG